MKYELFKKSLMLLLLGMSLCVYGQKTNEDDNREMEVGPEFECDVKRDYQFKIYGRFFRHKKKVYFCENSLPITIEVVDLDENPIPATYGTTWTGATANSTNHYSATIDVGDFTNGQCQIEATIYELADPSNSQDVCVRGWFSEFKTEDIINSQYTYDNNKIPEYNSYYAGPGIEGGIPWKFVESTQTNIITDIISAYSKPSKGYYPINIQIDQAIIQNNLTTDFTINPTSVGSQGLTTLTISKPTALPPPPSGTSWTLPGSVHGCSATRPELKIFSGDRVDKTVNFIVVCNSSGDCPNFTLNKAQLHLNEANQILNKAGVYLTLKDFHNNQVFAFDYNGNGAMEGNDVNQPAPMNEQKATAMHFMGTPFFNSDIQVMIVKDLGVEPSTSGTSTTIVRGRATTFGGNSLTLRSDLQVNGNETFAHEIGHAAFNLLHPDNLNPQVNDPNALMFGDAKERKNTIIRKVHFDKIY